MRAAVGEERERERKRFVSSGKWLDGDRGLLRGFFYLLFGRCLRWIGKFFESYRTILLIVENTGRRRLKFQIIIIMFTALTLVKMLLVLLSNFVTANLICGSLAEPDRPIFSVFEALKFLTCKFKCVQFSRD